MHGIDGLVVAHASIMPLVPSAPTNITTIMIADRVAGWLHTDGGRLSAASHQEG
ncbi:GMC oxidoreductase [Amycolatopsis sp. NPDC049253]|uniref:GMC oxidoreductase n=1 Tax=Amycolatopsis sp. NPDC049253 TaxID=3155274 RepID=UPI00341C252B